MHQICKVPLIDCADALPNVHLLLTVQMEGHSKAARDLIALSQLINQVTPCC